MSQNIHKEAAALTFITLMGFVPFLFLILLLLPELSFFSGDDKIQNLLISIFLPESATYISELIESLLSRRFSLNIISFIILVVSSYLLFLSVNHTFDNILNVQERKEKNIIFVLMKLFGMILFGFSLILILFSASSLPLVSNLINMPQLSKLSTFILPFILLFVFIILIYLFIPTIRIGGKSLFCGALLSSFAWVITKTFYNFYINNMTNIAALYGVLSSVPILLLWIYINWIIILGGVVVISIMEKRHESGFSVTDKSDRFRLVIERRAGDNQILKKNSLYIPREEFKKILKDILSE